MNLERYAKQSKNNELTYEESLKFISKIDEELKSKNQNNDPLINVLSDKKNKITKIIHLSDIHIESKPNRREEYIHVFDTLIDSIKLLGLDSNSTLICITGDMVDFKDNITGYGLEMTIYFLELLSSHFSIILLAGNHDVNINDPNCKDIITCVHNHIHSKYPVYYLKQSGLYRYNNLIFSVSSVFDRKLIPANTIKKRDGDSLVWMHHGFVVNPESNEDDYVKMHEHFLVNELNGYTIGLLGDIHKQVNINDHIKYASSLIQRNHGESTSQHGYLLWDIQKRQSRYILIKNQYGYLTYILSGNKIKKAPPPNNLKYARIKIKYEDTNKNYLNKVKKELNMRYKVIEMRTEEIIKTENQKIKLDDNIYVDKIKMADKDNIILILKKYLKEVKKIDNNLINKVIKEHDNYYKHIKKDDSSNKKITLLKLSFENLYSYGQPSNTIKFTNLKGVTLINGDNYAGKSSILDVITFLFFGRSIRDNGNRKNSIINVNKTTYSAELEFLVDDVQYKIIRSGSTKTKKSNNDTTIYKLIKNEYTEIHAFGAHKTNEQIQDIIGMTYDDFCFGCLMSQYENINMLSGENSQKKGVLTRCLQLDYFDMICANVKKDVNTINTETKMLSKRMDILDADIKKNAIKPEDTVQIDKDIKSVEKKINTRKSSLNELRYELKYIDNKYKDVNFNTELYKLNKDLSRTNSRLEEIELEITNTKKTNDSGVISNKKLQRIEDTVKTIINKNITNDKSYKKYKKEIDKVMDHIKPKTVINDSLKSIIMDIIQVNTDKLSEQYDTLDESYEEKTKSISKKTNIINNINNLTKYKEIIEHNNNVQEKIDTNENELDKLRNERDGIKNNIYEQKTKKELYKKAYDEYKKLKKKKKDFDSTSEILNIYKDAVDTNGVKLLIVEMVCSSLEKNVNHILSRFSDIRTKLNIVKTGKTVNIVVMMIQGKKEIHGSCTSGFERCAIDIATKLALSKYTNMSLPSFLVLDESISCIDSRHLQSIDRLFDFLRENIDITFVISHNDYIRDKFDNIVTVTRKDRNSYSKIIC